MASKPNDDHKPRPPRRPRPGSDAVPRIVISGEVVVVVNGQVVYEPPEA